MARGRPRKEITDSKPTENETYWDKISHEVSSNQSRLSMILGALIILVVGILVFNYFNKNKTELGPAQQTQQEAGDVSPDKLPGKYTVKKDDTLFIIAEKYYADGYKYEEIAKANNLNNPDLLETGQALEIPKLEGTPSSSPSQSPTLSPTPSSIPEQMPSGASTGEKGTPDVTMTQKDWGPKITSDKYTVQEGDWLSTVAVRAYGDILAYDRIAKANNITNPDLIYPGQILTIPR